MITNSEKLVLSKTIRKKVLMGYLSTAITCAVICMCYSTVLAAPTEAASGDTADETGVGVISNLADTIFTFIRIIGGVMAGWGIVQVGISFGSHDAQQRSSGFLFIAGGIIVAFSKEILKAAGISW